MEYHQVRVRSSFVCLFRTEVKRLILNLYNVYYLPNSPCNFVSLGRLNNSGVYNNKAKTCVRLENQEAFSAGPILEKQPHLNFPSTKPHIKILSIEYVDDSEIYIFAM